VREQLLCIFQEAYRDLRPQAPLPDLAVEFYSFANINNTIRLRQGRLLVRISDLLEGAPEPVIRALAHILLAKMYRRAIERTQAVRYRRYVSSHEIRRQAHVVRQLRGRKRLRTAQGHCYDLEAVFDQLNAKFFHGLLGRPCMSWSQNGARSMLGHYDPAHNAIIISRVFDHPSVPRYVVEYIVYHEMLHLKHPVTVRGGRRCVHPAEFRAEEKLFPHLQDAKKFLKRI
jgi:predicted metal-dependent hydrolase